MRGGGGCAVEVKGLGKYKNCLLGIALKQTYITLLIIKTESARSSSNKGTKTLYQDYLHCIANFCRALLNIFLKAIHF